jgi:glycosyltransferase involved in cell wall biosynthesis
MRVGLITETFLPDVNGVVTTLCRLLEHLQAGGHQALVFAPQGAPTSYAGAEIVPLPGVPLPLYPDLRLTPPQAGITARLRHFQPDVLHLAGPAVMGATGRFVASRLHLPLLATYHTDLPAYSAHYGLSGLRGLVYAYLRWVHNGCRLTLCPSTATLADLRAHGFRRLRLWGRGVDTERFHPRHRSEAWRRAVGLQPGETLLLYVGRLATEKRIDLLAAALAGLSSEGTPVRLVLVGDGPARPALERQLAGLPVHFAGFLKGDELATAYASADAFVFPSDTETFGQVIQEAMASGLPVMAARAGGALDLVRDGITGMLVAPGDAADLRAHIRQLAADPALRGALGQAGRRAAERRSWSSVMDELLGHYQRVQRHWTHPIRSAQRYGWVRVGN